MRAFLVALVLASVFAAGIRWGTFVAGGYDSYCYVHQAQRWASGRLQVPEPLALEAPTLRVDTTTEQEYAPDFGEIVAFVRRVGWT